MEKSSIPNELERVFQRLKDYNVSIIGSAVHDYATANDIDVLFHSEADFRAAIRRWGVKYNGWDQLSRLPDGREVKAHIRRANVHIPGVGKRVQFLQSDIPHEYARLDCDGTVHNGERRFKKDRPTTYLR